MKDGIRILGVDDAAFSFEDEETFLTGVVYRGTEFIEDIESVSIEVDGEDATDKVMELFQQVKNPKQLKVVLLDGISFAGFNVVDLERIFDKTGKPVIAVTGNEPDREDFRETMRRTGNYDEKFEKLDEASKLELKDGEVWIQFSGIGEKEAKEVVRKSVIHGLTPEAVRVAHMIGRGVESLKSDTGKI